jgi:hypothetical protein
MNENQVNPYDKIKQIEETDTTTQVNARLKIGWKLLWIYNRTYQHDSQGVASHQPVYVIGRE